MTRAYIDFSPLRLRRPVKRDKSRIIAGNARKLLAKCFRPLRSPPPSSVRASSHPLAPRSHYSPAQRRYRQTVIATFSTADAPHAKFFYGPAGARERRGPGACVSRDIKAHCCPGVGAGRCAPIIFFPIRPFGRTFARYIDAGRARARAPPRSNASITRCLLSVSTSDLSPVTCKSVGVRSVPSVPSRDVVSFSFARSSFLPLFASLFLRPLTLSSSRGLFVHGAKYGARGYVPSAQSRLEREIAVSGDKQARFSRETQIHQPNVSSAVRIARKRDTPVVTETKRRNGIAVRYVNGSDASTALFDRFYHITD